MAQRGVYHSLFGGKGFQLKGDRMHRSLNPRSLPSVVIFRGPLNVNVSTPTTEVTARAQIARARLGLW